MSMRAKKINWFGLELYLRKKNLSFSIRVYVFKGNYAIFTVMPDGEKLWGCH